ncbi:surface protein 1 [Xylariales sp. AK1849]|nr:surface protein 1 [Xylariales sp. AK1849]
MRFTTAILSAIFSCAVFATPAPGQDKELPENAMSVAIVDMLAADQAWTLRHFDRTCDDKDRFCNWEFWIDTGNGAKPQYCSFEVDAPDGGMASRTDVYWIQCNNYLVSTHWDDFFGFGYTQLSIYDQNAKLIIFPGYTDKELCQDGPVQPDKRYHPDFLG